MKKCRTSIRLIWVFMKFSGIQCFLITLFSGLAIGAPVASNGQSVLDKRLTLQADNQKIESVLSTIEKSVSIRFAYNPRASYVDKKVSFEYKDIRLADLLEKILAPIDLTFEVVGEYIILREKEQETSLINPSNDEPNGAFTVSGTVKDDQGDLLPGVNIVVKGTTTGTTSDADGKYSLVVPIGDETLVFSFIGFATQEVSIQNRSVIDVVMVADARALSEVVVIGYGTVKKSNLTGAVSSVKMDDLPKIATNNVSNVLIGRVSGLSIRQNSAAPGAGYDIVIRGAASTGAGNSPLFVIDGFPGGDINTVNPDDIETVEVLKDASATAIYGARAANGVILINTKKGKKGTMNISVNSTVSVQQISKPYEMVSSRNYMEMSNDFFHEEWLYNNKIAPYGNVDLSTVASTPKVAFTEEQITNAGQATDWFDEITRSGVINEQSVSVNGGSENVRYLFSMGHLGQKGVIVNSGFEQYLGRLNLELDLSKWLTTGISISASQSARDNIAQSSGPAQGGMIADAMMYPQYLPVYDEEGNYTINPDHPTTANPVSWKDVKNRDHSLRALVNNFWEVRLTEELDFRMNWGVNALYGQNSLFYPKTHLTGIELNTSASINKEWRYDYLLDATLTYSKRISNTHQLKAMAGYAYQMFNTERLGAGNSDFLTDIFGPYNLGAGGNLTKTVSSEKSATKYLSYFARINYDIADKYLFTFTVRSDGSDKFGEQNKFGYFPSGAFAWRIIEEGFMKSQSPLSNLKLRLSAGQIGNAQIGGNAYGFYVTGANYVFGNSLITGISENQLPNPRLKWETTTEYNIGLDWGLFGDRLTGSVEYYHQVISDLLDQRTVGSYYPVEAVADNLGKTESKGFEVQLSSINLAKGSFKWTTDLNLFQYRDRWKERNPFAILSIYEGVTDPLHVGYGYLSDGLIQEGESVSHMPDAPAGSIKVTDLNGWLKDQEGNFILDQEGNKQLSGTPDDAIDDADKVIIHNQAPELSFGLNNTFTFKGFDLSLFFYGEIGRQLNNVTRMDFLRADKFRFADNVTTDALDRWSSSNPDGKYPSGLFPRYENNTDFYIEDADFVRLKNLTLGYTIPPNVGNGLLKNARFFVDAQNLFVVSNYTGSDPETDRFTAYPNQRTYTLGVNLSF